VFIRQELAASSTMAFARLFLRSRVHRQLSRRVLQVSICRQNELDFRSTRQFCGLIPKPEDDEGLIIPRKDTPAERKASSDKVEAIAASISDLSMLEVVDLVENLKEKLGMQGMDFGIAGGGGGGGGAADAVEEEVEEVVEQTEFAVKLTKFDPKAKIKLIKEVRKIGGFGLKEAKEIVESAPVILKKDLSKEEAEELKAVITGLGGEVELE